MPARADLLGAVTALVIYGSSILVFVARLLGRAGLGRWAGILFLLCAFPLIYLLLQAPRLDRPPLYYVQAGLMLAAIVAVFLLDYVFHVEFRDNRAAVIAFVVLFFAGTGGMLGVAALAGRTWLIASAILFLVMAVLAFVQRAVTGM